MSSFVHKQPPPLEMERRVAVLLQSVETARELSTREFPPIEWIVPGLLPGGVTILAARPKTGKSWLALMISGIVSVGGEVLGQQVKRGRVLYLSLEDGERRVRARLDSLKMVMSDYLQFAWSWNRDETALEDLRLYLMYHGDCRLIVVDTLGRIRSAHGDDAYQEDAEFLNALRRIAEGRHVAILLVYHTRKAAADDFVDSVLGSTGISGGVDTIWIMKRNRGDREAVLSITGRDLPEEKELALRFEDGGVWTLLGDAVEHRQGAERQQILSVLREAGEAMTAKELAALLEKNTSTTWNLLAKMARDGLIKKVGYGKYK